MTFHELQLTFNGAINRTFVDDYAAAAVTERPTPEATGKKHRITIQHL